MSARAVEVATFSLAVQGTVAGAPKFGATPGGVGPSSPQEKLWGFPRRVITDVGPGVSYSGQLVGPEMPETSQSTRPLDIPENGAGRGEERFNLRRSPQ